MEYAVVEGGATLCWEFSNWGPDTCRWGLHGGPAGPHPAEHHRGLSHIQEAAGRCGGGEWRWELGREGLKTGTTGSGQAV